MYRHPQQRSELPEFDQNQDAYGMHSHMHPQENGFHSNNVTASRLYNTAGSQQRMHSNSFSDYPAEQESQKNQKGFGTGASYRSSFSLHPISNHTRPQSQTNTSYDHPNAYGPSDMYPAQVTSPTQSSLQPFDTRGSFEFHSGSTVHGGAQRSPGLLDSYIGPQQASMMLSQLKAGPQHHGSGFGQHSTGSYAVSSQTPFGPHIPSTATGSSTPMNAAPTPSAAGAPAPSQASHQHEEISTIFVVGFPDDMQEREFQNMFTFCPDFEAATLKIPNKEFSTYGAAGNTSTRAAGSSFHQFLPNSTEGFSNGIVVDSRDGTVSWPNMDDGAGATSFATGGAQSNVPPRKQIIGFAKFKTKEGAFRAREQLQGRRVDIEKGAILKAEMAKKNLHTKRGVGPIPGSTTSGTGMAPTGNTPQPASQPAPVTAADVFGTGITDGHTIRDSSTIGGSSRVSHWREHALDTQGNSPQFAPPSWEREAGPRSLRDRLADDEQEWRTREKLANASYMRSNPEPVEYSVGLAPVAEHLEEDFDGYTAGPWDNVSGVPQQSLSRRSSSEANFVDPSHVYPHSSRSSNEGDYRGAVDLTNPMSTDLSTSINNLTLTTRQNNSSPELPSPSSNSSGGSGGKPGVDQNPPINTLYVGNLPISPLPNLHAEPLEERLRSLFAERTGYRRLSFKQKNTGPMCFVEFEDVQAATAALKALQGHTLGGLVKGGVRLSYSKNPLGVRTPTSATSTSSQQQHQTLGGAMDDNRSIFVRSDRSERRDHSQPYISSPPPPRFANANSSNASYFGLGSTQEFVPRANYSYSLANELSNFGSYGRSPFTSDLLHGEPGVSRVLSPTST